MQTFHVQITGRTPLLMHADNIEWADKMEAWKNDAGNKKLGKAGDDRSPSWRWIGCLNHDGEVVTIPSEYIQAAILGGAAFVPIPGGKNGKTFKSDSQSGLQCSELHWTLKISGKVIKMTDINAMTKLSGFAAHVETAKELGFDLFVKRARIGTAKHIRVRPRFDNWSVDGSIVSFDERIDQKILQEILDQAGRFKGLGDWRPGAKTPGPWGTFTAKVKAA